MLDYGLPILLLILGPLMVWQGVQRLQGKRGKRLDLITRLATPSMSDEDKEKALKAHEMSNKVQGVMRIAFGLFVAGLGIYLLVI